MSRSFYNYVREEYFERFYQGEERSSEFYRDLVGSTNITDKDAMQVTRLLDKDKIREADHLVKELLVDDAEQN